MMSSDLSPFRTLSPRSASRFWCQRRNLQILISCCHRWVWSSEASEIGVQVGDYGTYQLVFFFIICLPASLPSAFSGFPSLQFPIPACFSSIQHPIRRREPSSQMSHSGRKGVPETVDKWFCKLPWMSLVGSKVSVLRKSFPASSTMNHRLTFSEHLHQHPSRHTGKVSLRFNWNHLLPVTESTWWDVKTDGTTTIPRI